MVRTAITVVFVMIVATVVLAWSDDAHAQPPPPALTTNPSPPPAYQTFDAAFNFYWYPSAWGVRQEGIRVNGNVITVPFDFSCGFICPGIRFYYPYRFRMPALAPGHYRVKVTSVGGADVVAEFSLDVGAVAVPASNPLTLVALLLVLLAVGSLYAGRIQTVRRG